MKDKIKKMIKKVVLPLFISVLMGGICGHLVYEIYIDNNDVAFSSNIVYVLQTGAYSDYNNMRANSLSNDYIYYEDDGMFKTIIGITQDKDNIDKIKNAYGDDIVVGKYLISDYALYKKIKEFDDRIKKEDDSKRINSLVIAMLKIYQEKKNIELTAYK